MEIQVGYGLQNGVAMLVIFLSICDALLIITFCSINAGNDFVSGTDILQILCKAADDL